MIERGHVLPLFRGSIARIILAHLPYRRLHDLYAANKAAIAEAGLARDWPSFLKALREIRTTGHYISLGELNLAVRAIAAPLFNAEGDVLGSLTLAMRARATITAARQEALVARPLGRRQPHQQGAGAADRRAAQAAAAPQRRPLSRRSG